MTFWYSFLQGYCAVLKGLGRLSSISGGYGEGETPLPFPNRAVKPLSADGTWPARARESRSPPVSSAQRTAFGWSVVVAGRAGAARCRWHLPATWSASGRGRVRKAPVGDAMMRWRACGPRHARCPRRAERYRVSGASGVLLVTSICWTKMQDPSARHVHMLDAERKTRRRRDPVIVRAVGPAARRAARSPGSARDLQVGDLRRVGRRSRPAGALGEGVTLRCSASADVDHVPAPSCARSPASSRSTIRTLNRLIRHGGSLG